MNTNGKRCLTLLMIGLVIALPAVLFLPVDAEEDTYFYGYVKDKETGEPLADAKIIVAGNRIGTETDADENGYYKYTVEKGGEYSIFANCDGYYDQMKEETIRSGNSVQVDFFLKAYGSLITGHVFDSVSGDPVEGAYVEFRNTEITSGDRTDENGFYKIGVEPGIYDLSVNSETYKTYNEDGIVIKEGDENSMDIQLDPHSSGIFGKVFDEDGNPLEMAVVKAQGIEGMNGIWTDEEGYYSIGLEPGKYRIVVYRSGYFSSSAPVEILEDDMIEMDWTLSEEISQSLIMRLIKWFTGLIGMV